jgi:hypothetical protein
VDTAAATPDSTPLINDRTALSWSVDADFSIDSAIP